MDRSTKSASSHSSHEIIEVEAIPVQGSGAEPPRDHRADRVDSIGIGLGTIVMLMLGLFLFLLVFKWFGIILLFFVFGNSIARVLPWLGRAAGQLFTARFWRRVLGRT